MALYPTIQETFASPIRTIPKRGVLSLSMRTCPFQPTVNSIKGRPRFFGNDGVGNYFGLNGYYGTVPCWLPFGKNFTPYQSSTFFIFEGGLFDSDALLSNPFSLQPKITSLANSFYYGGELAWPYTYGVSPASNQPTTVSMGPGKLFLGQSTINGNNINQVGAPWPQITFESVTTKLSGAGEIQQIDLSERYCSNALNTLGSNGLALISTLANDALHNAYTQGISTLTGYAPCGTSRQVYDMTANVSNAFLQGAFPCRYNGGGPISSPDPFNPIAPWSEPLTVTKINGTTYSWFNATSGSYKMHPNQGNFISCGIAGSTPIIGNAFASWDAGTGVLDPFQFMTAALSDPSDNTAFQISNIAAQQVPGGGFLCWNSSTLGSTMWLIAPNFSFYYTIQLAGLVGNLTNVTQDRIGVDQNGILYFLNYSGFSGGTFVNMQYSGRGTTVIPLALPPLTRIGVACDTFRSEPWQG